MVRPDAPYKRLPIRTLLNRLFRAPFVFAVRRHGLAKARNRATRNKATAEGGCPPRFFQRPEPLLDSRLRGNDGEEKLSVVGFHRSSGIT